MLFWFALVQHLFSSDHVVAHIQTIVHLPIQLLFGKRIRIESCAECMCV